jgi:hypothetical protein
MKQTNWVHKDINRAKGNRSDKEYIQECTKVVRLYENNINKETERHDG